MAVHAPAGSLVSRAVRYVRCTIQVCPQTAPCWAPLNTLAEHTKCRLLAPACCVSVQAGARWDRHAPLEGTRHHHWPVHGPPHPAHRQLPMAPKRSLVASSPQALADSLEAFTAAWCTSHNLTSVDMNDHLLEAVAKMYEAQRVCAAARTFAELGGEAISRLESGYEVLNTLDATSQGRIVAHVTRTLEVASRVLALADDAGRDALVARTNALAAAVCPKTPSPAKRQKMGTGLGNFDLLIYTVIMCALDIPVRGTTTEEKRVSVRDLISMWTPSERETYANVVTMVRSLGTNKKAMKHYAGDLAADLHAKGCPGTIAAAVAAKFKGVNTHRADSATTDQTGSESPSLRGMAV